MTSRRATVVRNENVTVASPVSQAVAGTEIYCCVNHNGVYDIPISDPDPVCTLSFEVFPNPFRRIFFSATVAGIAVNDDSSGSSYGVVAALINVTGRGVTPYVTVPLEFGGLELARGNATITGALDVNFTNVDVSLYVVPQFFGTTADVRAASLQAIVGQDVSVQECWVIDCA